ncbi:uncharacterized protein LOC143841529 [Paroedura picta]|uniref:uncharacterized protein LOC143841529 n=1 Tax=Paroedura picta TaxID=143630 RepID=UPI004055F4FD
MGISRGRFLKRQRSSALKQRHRSRAPIRSKNQASSAAQGNLDTAESESSDSDAQSVSSLTSNGSRGSKPRGRKASKNSSRNYWRGYARAVEQMSKKQQASGSIGRVSSGESSDGGSCTSAESDQAVKASACQQKRQYKAKGCKRRRSVRTSSLSGREISSSGPWSKRKSGHLPRRPVVTWRRVIMMGVLRSLAPSTRRAYEGAVRNFMSYAATLGCGGKWPMSERLLLCYLVYLWEKGISPCTIRVHMAGLSFFSRVLGSWDPSSLFLAKKAISGWRRVQPTCKDLQQPITKSLLQGLINVLKRMCSSKYEVSLTRAAFSLAFFGAFRCGEILSPSRSTYSKGVLTRNDVCIQDNSILVRLKRSKTDQLGRGCSVLIPESSNYRICPVHWLSKFLRIRPQSEGPLLIHRDGTYFSRFQFSAILRACLRKMGLVAKNYGTHSFRIGAATQAFQDGASAEQIMSLGRWRSAAYKSYVRPVAVY